MISISCKTFILGGSNRNCENLQMVSMDDLGWVLRTYNWQAASILCEAGTAAPKPFPDCSDWRALMICAICSLHFSISMIFVLCPSLSVVSISLRTPLFPIAADDWERSDADAFDSLEPPSLTSTSASSSPRGRQKRASSCEWRARCRAYWFPAFKASLHSEQLTTLLSNSRSQHSSFQSMQWAELHA